MKDSLVKALFDDDYIDGDVKNGVVQIRGGTHKNIDDAFKSEVMFAQYKGTVYVMRIDEERYMADDKSYMPPIFIIDSMTDGNDGYSTIRLILGDTRRFAESLLKEYDKAEEERVIEEYKANHMNSQS